MKIGLVRSGGLAGLTTTCEVDTAKLSAGEARELEQLVAKLEASGVTDSPGPGKPDRFQYEVTVENGKSRCYRMGEHELTPEGRELVRRLIDRARTA